MRYIVVHVAVSRERVIRTDYSQMTKQELVASRSGLESDLADYEEMANYHFANSVAHISAHEVQRESHRRQRVKDAIAEIDRILADAAP